MTNDLHFALIVAICQYPGGYPELDGPRNDADAFREWLVDADGGALPPGNVVEHITPRYRLTLENAHPLIAHVETGLEALRDNAWSRLEAFPEDKRQEAQRRSRLYVFVAGHGITPGDGTGGLLDALARPSATTCLDLGAYGRWLVEDATFGEVILFGDCCRNYDPVMRAVPPDLGPNTRYRVDTVARLTSYATTAGGAAHEGWTRAPGSSSREPRGYFTEALVDGLGRGAVHPRKRSVTPGRLHEHVRARVARETSQLLPEQRQAVDTNGLEDAGFTFGPERDAPLYEVTVHFPDGFARSVDLVMPGGERRSRDSDCREWTHHLHDGLYWLDPPDGFASDPVFEVSGEDRHVVLN